MSDQPCLFCDIISGKRPARKIYEDELATVFEDIAPQAPFHYLVIPNKHISSLNEINEENQMIMAHLLERAVFIARQQGFADDGYRLVTNCGRKAGQSVFHLHFHLIAGRHFSWPPG
ncbi:histidine triad nucleotide-binding protein [candidate division CSSED10-310 bacterium]|uniref:Histidine triad nucleotide-binding protein n=1 Tax=candidate division CSSED10-310 bacterium TaxID=2855610 RepID=A0ABV6YVD3_UNCC1